MGAMRSWRLSLAPAGPTIARMTSIRIVRGIP
jgi:hypothetical protein